MALVIQSDLDFTPIGKRAARTIKSTRGYQHRWYVGGRIFRHNAPMHLSAEWIANEGAANNCPQPWELFQ